MIVFENWIKKPFSKTNQEPESAINLAELYWQGLDPNFRISYIISFSLKNRWCFVHLNKISSVTKMAIKSILLDRIKKIRINLFIWTGQDLYY